MGTFPQLILPLAILIFLQPNPTFCAAPSSYTCIGGGRGGPTVTRCVQVGSQVPPVWECPSSATDPLRAAEGCERDGTTGGADYWCCPQYCGDGQTMVYYRQITTSMGGGQTLGPTDTCTGPGQCPTNSSEQCEQPNPTDGRWFCCPRSNALPSGRAGQGQCEDIGGQDCLLKDFLCNNTLYFDLMSWQCASTCNRCPADNSQPTRPPNIAANPLNQNCRDMLDCPTWKKNGFCRNDFYSMDTRAAMCPLSCQLGCALMNGTQI